MTESRENLAVVGTYTDDGGDGLVTFAVDPDRHTLERRDTVEAANPSFFAFHPSNETLVAVEEVGDGSLVSCHLDDETGRLRQLNRTSSGGDGPCHVAIDPIGEYAVISHYAGGSVGLVGLGPEGELAGVVDRQEHDGSGLDPSRQASPHPHSVNFVTDSVVYVPDLGTDRLFVYELDRTADRLRPVESGHLDVQSGAGPRHFARHPDVPVGYLVNELDSTITVLDLSDVRHPTATESISTLPQDPDPGENTAAAIHVNPRGEYLLSSNRGHDSIACFDVAAEPSTPEFVGTTPSGGQWPREFTFSPVGSTIYVCNQHSNAILPLEFSDGDVRESDAAGVSIAAPACMKFR